MNLPTTPIMPLRKSATDDTSQCQKVLALPGCFLVFLSAEKHPDAEAELQRYLRHENSPEDHRYWAFLNRWSSLHLAPRLPPGDSGLDYGSGPGPTLSVMLEKQGSATDIYDPYFASDPSVLERTYDFITCTRRRSTSTTRHWNSDD